MIYRLKVDKIANKIFCIALTIELLIMMLGHSAFDIPYRGRLTHLAFFLFGCKVLLTKYTKREKLAIVCLGIIGAISYFAIRDEWVIRIIMMVVASKNIVLKKVLRYIFWVSLIGTIVIVMLSLFGIGGQLVDIRDYGRGEIESRWCLGFSHANNIHGTIWYILSIGILVYFQKLKWYHYLIFSVANIGLYMLTLSRGGWLVIQAVIVAAFVYRYYPKIAERKWIYFLGMSGTLFCAGIGIYVVIFGIDTTPGLRKLSDVLTRRLEVLTWWEKTEYWKLFGSIRERRLTDVGFITVLARYGYVVFALYLLIILLLVGYYCRNKKWMEFVVLMTCVVYTFMESTYTINVYLLCNFTFLLLIGTWNHLLTKGRQDESV